MPRKKDEAPVDPNKLVRQEAGTYRTADERFEVRGTGNRWFLVDTQRTDELGQELVRGPLATLEAAREAIPEARREDLRPLPARRTAKKTTAATAPTKPTPKPKPAPPPSWIDRLPRAEATEVRALIRALEREGVNGAEQLVRRDREGLEPAVATHLVQRRLAEIVDEFPADGRAAIRALVDRVVAVLSDEGGRRHDPLPGWLLVEVGPQPEPDNRRIRLND
ncbi:MAG TPA: hypothetical protein VMP67_07515 [Candidatus Limnocylindria bacterium]|nr:hypothetical protein [Candidatus Limnocylindria bacterium]